MTPTSTAPVIEVSHASKRYGTFTALNDVSITIERDKIYGLLGRNGAGKTTLMKVLTAQEFADRGSVTVLGDAPYERASILSQLCFVREGQKFPDAYRVRTALKIASLFYENWDHDFADELVVEFALPVNRQIKKLSRGQTSAIGIVIGLAARAPITIFDEPYLGLDAVARQIFYDRLLADYAEHPRTILLSTHLIDEVSNLLEHVLVIDSGSIILDESADSLRGRASSITGSTANVDRAIADRTVLHRTSVGSLSTAIVEGGPSAMALAEATTLGVEIAPVSLQQLIVQLTQTSTGSLREEATHV